MKVESAVVEENSLLLSVRVSFAEIFKGGFMPPVEQLPISLPKKLPKQLKPKVPRKKKVQNVKMQEETDDDEDEEEIKGGPEEDEEILIEKVVKASKINDELEKIEESIGILDERCKAAYSAIQAGKQERPEICKAAKIPYSSLSPVLIKLEQKKLIKKIGYGKFGVVSK